MAKSKRKLKVPTPVQVGEALRNLRERLALSQTAFGEPAGLHHQQISRYEGGLDTPLTMTVLRLLTGHGLTLHDLQDELDAVMGYEPARPARMPEIDPAVLTAVIEALLDRLENRRRRPALARRRARGF